MKATTTSLQAAASWEDVRLGVMGAGEASSWFDAKVIDGTVNGAGWRHTRRSHAFDVVG